MNQFWGIGQNEMGRLNLTMADGPPSSPAIGERLPGFTGSWSKIYDFPAWISQIGNIAENAHLHRNKEAFLSELDGFKPSSLATEFQSHL
jgi:hypothetical protein